MAGQQQSRRASYNDPAHPDCNLRFPIWQLLRASTAAPTYFQPEDAADRLAQRISSSTAASRRSTIRRCSPSLMATLPCYKLEWETGVDNLFVLSIGTGSQPVRLAKSDAQQVNWLDSGELRAAGIDVLAGRSSRTHCAGCWATAVSARQIDSEMGDLHGPGLLSAAEKKFAYVRYNRMFDANEAPRLASGKQVRFTLDNLELIPFLQEAGRQYASRTRDVRTPAS